MHFSWSAKIGFGLLIATWLAFSVNFIGNSLVDVEELEKSAYQVLSDDAEDKVEVKEEVAAAPDVLALLASADIGRGQKVFRKCKACHSADEGGKNKVGPNLWDIVGRGKAASGGFKYSAALTDKGGEWSYADLDAFLTSPKTFINGTKMSFVGVKKAADRAAVIVYLRSLSASPKSLP